MGGGLLQLVAYGAQDAYLSGNPQITFWKGLYKRHTNFAMEPFRINFNGQPTWGTKQTAIVGRHADLLFSTYVEIQMPTTYSDKTTAAKWNHGVNAGKGRYPLGYNLIDYVELDIGGQIVDRQYSEFMYLWSELTYDTQKVTKLNSMLTNEKYNSSALTFSDPVGCSTGQGRSSLPNTLYIPLMFFFTKNPGAALPLIALQYHEVKINVQWNETTMIGGSISDLRTRQLQGPVSAAMYIDYIYLDTEERRRFAQQSHEYLIEQTQFNEDVGIASASQRIDLTFNHPVKELLWVVQPSCYRDCKAPVKELRTTVTDRLLPFCYDLSASNKAPVYEQYLQINGQDRLEKRYGDYFNKVQPFQHHTGISPGVGVYTYSFAVKPEEHQPSGTCNFSRIDTATIVMTIDGSVTVNADTEDTWGVRVYAVNYNVLRIMSGMGGLAYSN
jgi:hypothetical protein